MRAGAAVSGLVLVALLAVSCGSGTDDEAAAPTTTAAATEEPTTSADTSAAAGEVWTYTDSTGETFTVEKDDDTGFTGGAPSPVALMDASKDCAFLLQEAAFWDEQSTSDYSEEYKANAEAYAMYARDLHVKRDC